MATKKGQADAEDERSALTTLRDLLTKSVMLPSDRLRGTLDDAVKRGRITRDDADELVDRLVALGRQQSDDALSRLEGLLPGGGRSDAESKGGSRRPPGTDRVLREVDRARRAVGLGGSSSFPISGYDELTAAQVINRLQDLSSADLRKVAEHERRNANRKMVLAAIEKRLR